MAARLRETTVAEICEVYDGPHATPTKTSIGPFFLGITSLNKGRIDLAGSEHLSEEDFAKWTRRVTPKPGDVVFSYETKLGEAAIIPEGLRCCLGRRMALMRPDPTKADSRFLLYYYLGPEFQDVIRERTIHGSTVDRLALIEFPKFPLRLPPLAEQKVIASVLGTLDDKIELNRRMNATLEAMARALFQSWFVDFDPVRAKLDGRPPAGLDPATAALFPDSFQDSEAGHIPKGWTIQPVGEVVDCVGGGTPSTAEPKYWEGGTHHWTTPKDFSSLQAPILFDTDRKLTHAGIAKISSGLLPAGTLLLSSRAPVGYLAIAAMPVAINQGFIALKCNDRASNFFMLNWCQTNMAEIESRATGTTFAEISKQNFRPIRVVLSPKELMAAFTARVAPFYAQITANLHQSRTLVTVRDTLLPKLLSDGIRVGADKITRG
jgi:type I restriction enzyme, S subunit